MSHSDQTNEPPAEVVTYSAGGFSFDPAAVQRWKNYTGTKPKTVTITLEQLRRLYREAKKP